MKALVTGGGGFLGSAIVRLLHRRGHEVRVLGRGRYPHLTGYAAQFFQDDIRSAGAVRAACVGADVVFHTAAKAGVWGSASDFHAINVEGTRHVIEACQANGVRKLVHTSTPSVVFDHGDLCSADESQPIAARFLCEYAATKAVAEQMVLSAHGAELATVALRPHLLFGPGDPHLLPRIIARARQGKLRQVGDGSNMVDLTYVDNAAEAHIAAAERLACGSPCGGRAYFISNGEPVKLWPWIAALLDRLGLPPARRAMSLTTAYRLGGFFEAVFLALRLGGEPPMTRFVALQLAKSHYFDISAARRDLGYLPSVSLDEGVARWAASQGHVLA